MPNLEGISVHFQTQIEQHKQEIIIIETTRDKCLMSAKAYWQSYKSKQALALRQTLICSKTMSNLYYEAPTGKVSGKKTALYVL